MATDTAQVSPPVRVDPRQVINTLKRTLNFNDADIAKAAFDNALPSGSFVTCVQCEIQTAFNAGTTNPITVGTNATTYNNLLASGDITSATPGVYQILSSGTTKLGRAFAASGDVAVFATYIPTGTAATTGKAVIVLQYEGGWAS